MASMTGRSLAAWLAGSVVVLLLLFGAFVWSGLYNVAADAPHSRLVHALLETLRQRSIAVRADDLRVPDLADAELIRQGAGNYDAMCVICHLAPGMSETELSRGLYPAPPALPRTGSGDPARAFWVIKHGIKASGMPAWGESMADEYIWGMVAFLQQLPQLDAAAYRELVASSPGHSHGGTETDGHDHGAAQGHDHADSGASAEPASGSTVHRHADGSTHVHAKPQSGAARAPALDVPAAAEPAVAVVDAFGAALARGDLKAAGALLDPGVVILENGGAERSREEYLRGHAGADAQFLSGATLELARRSAHVTGDTAWVTSESEIRATHEGAAVTLLGTETMVLSRTPAGWRIVHIHWSSKPKRAT